MLNHKLLHVQLSFQSTLTHKWGLEQNQFIGNSCIFSWLCTAVAFQRGSRFCPLTHVRTFLPALSFKLYYVDLDFIERGSLSEARSDVTAEYGIQVKGLSAVFTKCAIICTKGKLWVLLLLIGNGLFEMSLILLIFQGSAFSSALDLSNFTSQSRAGYGLKQ